MIDDSNTAYIFDAIRTPRGKGRPSGSLHIAKPISLVVGLISELRNRHPDLAPEAIEDIVLGIVSPRDEQGSVLPRIAALAAGLPVTVGGLQVNRFCGSGLEAVNIAAQKVQSGSESLVLAGGVESMSRVAMGSDGGAWFEDPATSIATGYVPQGIGADLIATIEGFDRESVDAYAIRSQRLAAAAWSGGYFAKSVVPVKDEHGFTLLDRDEHLRPEATLGSLAKLEPAFARLGADGFDAVALSRYHWVDRIDHVHHAGNSSGIVDGASLVVIGNKDAGTRCGLTPAPASPPRRRPVPTPPSCSPGPPRPHRNCSQRLDCVPTKSTSSRSTKPSQPSSSNTSKISICRKTKSTSMVARSPWDTPLGATGAMLVGTIVDELERRDAHRAVVTLCIGAGMGVATLIERV